MEPTLDIFRGTKDNPVWIEKQVGLVKASERMRQLAAENPDSYFVFDHSTQTVVAQIDRSVAAD